MDAARQREFDAQKLEEINTALLKACKRLDKINQKKWDTLKLIVELRADKEMYKRRLL